MPDTDTPKPPRHGKSMIAAFRAERLANRPAQRAERIAARESLRNERLGRLYPSEPAQVTPPPPVPPEVQAPDAVASPVSLFAQLVENERQALTPAPEPEEPAVEPTPTSMVKAATPLREVPLQQTDIHPLVAPAPEPDAIEPAMRQAALVVEPPARTDAVEAEPCPDLTALGFGPGMTARLHLLGIVSVTDLAAADAEALRNSLGDVGDLVNVDFWINQARTLLRAAA